MKFSSNRLPDFCYGVVFTAGILVCITSLLPLGARHHWVLDVFSHFRVQMVLCLSLAMGILLFSQVKKYAWIFLLFIAFNLVEIIPFYLDSTESPSAYENELSICLLNVNSSSGDPQKVLSYFQTLESDVIVIQEYSSRWTHIQEALRETYPHQLTEIREDNFGMALLSKREFISEEVFFFTEEILPSLGVEIVTGNKKVFLLATHPLPPAGVENTDLRNRQLAEIGSFLRDSSGPVLLVGDLNTTPWSPVFKDLLQVSGLQNSMKGFGIQPTWPVFIPPLWIPLDHLLHSPDLVVKSREIGPDVGSDHFPLEVTLFVPMGILESKK